MLTRSEIKRRKRARAGRPRKEGEREANGRLSRVIGVNSNEDPRTVVINQRKQHFGLDDKAARSADAGTEYGRMFDKGLITRGERDVCQRYESLDRAYHSAMCSPRLVGGYPGAGGSGENAESELRAIRAYDEVLALFEGMEALHIGIRAVVIRGQKADTWQPLDRFKLGVEMLGKFWGIDLDPDPEP